MEDSHKVLPPTFNRECREPPFKVRGLYLETGFTTSGVERSALSSILFIVVFVTIWRLATGNRSVAAGFDSLTVGVTTLINTKRKGS